MNSHNYLSIFNLTKFFIYWTVILLITFLSSFRLTINPILAIEVSGIATINIFLWHFLYFHQWKCYPVYQTSNEINPKIELPPLPESKVDLSQKQYPENITNNPFDFP